VQLVEDDVPQRRTEEMAVLPPHEEELELLVVGQQEVGRVGADLRTPEPFGLRRLLLQPQRGDVAVAGVEAEEEIDTGTADEASQPLELVVDARGAALAVGCTAAGVGLGAHQRGTLSRCVNELKAA